MLEHLKSGLSISTHIGCPMRCNYCVLSIMGSFSKGPILEATPESIVEELFKDECLFVNGVTPLFINNRTDPLLPSVREYTYRLLELCKVKNILSPIIIISKFPPKKELMPYFDVLHLMYIYSYSGYSQDFNYDKIDNDIRAICRNIPAEARFHYLRPIIPGINDDVENICNILNKFYIARFAGSIMAGFRVNKENRSLLVPNIDYSTQHKIFPADKYSDLYDKIGGRYNLFRHTSCGISFFLKSYNRLNYFGKSGHCFPNCANFETCALKRVASELEVNTFLSSRLHHITKWKYENGILHIEDEINQEVVAFIKNALGVSVVAENLTLSLSEQLITQ